MLRSTLTRLATVATRSPSSSIARGVAIGAFRPSAALLQQKGAKGGGAAGGKKGADAGAAAPEEKFDLTKVIPVNILKEGKDPEYKDDKEYPAWLFKLTEERETTDEMLMRGIENLTFSETKQMFKRVRRQAVREHNQANKKRA